MKRTKKILIIVLCVILALILTLVATFFILTAIGKHQFHKDDVHVSTNQVTVEDEETISYNGNKYVLNDDIISILVVGVDRENIKDDLGRGNNGQADLILLATMNTNTKEASLIPISRETMVDVNLYTTDGKFAGTKREQLCLAYAYGNTPEECSENVMTSVRRLFYGININSYVTIEMDGIKKLTGLVGGVELTCLEDIEYRDYQPNKGDKITLTEDTVRYYIQYRGNDLESNERRMQRQKQFLSALINKTGNAIMSDFSNLTTYYNSLSPYFSTNISFAQITYLAENCLSMNLGDTLNFKSIEGTLTQNGEEWVQFTINEESLLQTIIDTYYIQQ